MVEEKSIKDQISALEGWSIQAYHELNSGNYLRVLKLLKEINYQSRVLEFPLSTVL